VSNNLLGERINKCLVNMEKNSTDNYKMMQQVYGKGTMIIAQVPVWI